MPLIETYANNYSTTLSGDITSGATSLVVANTAGEPLAPQFRSLIDSELILTTAMAGTTWTITRGIEGTTAVAHSSGATITHVLTSGGLVGVAGNTHLSDTYANLPATGVVGRLFLPTNDIAIYREGTNGWSAFGPVYPITTPPALSNWTQINFGTGSGSGVATQQGSMIHLLAPANASANRRVLAMTAPTTGYTITALIRPEVWEQTFPMCGVGWRDSATAKQAFLRFGGDSNLQFNIYSGTCTSDTGSYASYTLGSNWNSASSLAGAQNSNLLWVQIQNDGTNRTINFSWNGYDFYLLHKVAYSDFPASSMNPNQVIIFTDAINSTYSAGMSLLSWSITQP